MARAETLKGEPGFRRNICRARRAWNRVYPEYALGEPGWMPTEGMHEYRLVVLPPALAQRHNAAVKAGRDAAAETWQAFSRWRRLVLSLCEWGWPRDRGFPNWLNEKSTHPAVLFVSASLLWRPDSVPAASIVTGGPPAQPLLFDPGDEMSHPGAAFWHAYAKHFVGALRAAIEDGDQIDIPWHERTNLNAFRVGMNEREIRLDAGQAQPFWYVHIFPGITTSDRDEMMSSVMEAASYQFGDHPLRRPVSELSAKGKSQAQIAKLLGVDRGVVRRLLNGR